MAARQEILLTVHGMTCEACVHHVQQALESVAGVVAAEVPRWRSAQARVIASPEVNDGALLRAIEEAGYWAQVRKRRPLEEPRPLDAGELDLVVIGGGSAGFAAALRAARRVDVVVAGVRKRAALRRALMGPPDPLTCPASAVSSREGLVVWWVDRAAAGRGVPRAEVS